MQSTTIDGVLKKILRQTRIRDAGLVEAVAASAREYWPDLRDGSVEIADFKRGVLHVLLDSHARLAEARGFIGDGFREHINRLLAERLAVTATPERSRVPLVAWQGKEVSHVTRVVFRVRGTYS